MKLFFVSSVCLVLATGCAGSNDSQGPGSSGNGGGGGGSVEGGAGPGGPTMTADEYLEASYRARCERKLSCCDTSEDLMSVEECMAVLRENGQWIATAIEQGFATYDPSAAPACIEALDALDCADSFSHEPPSCILVAVGNQAVGEACGNGTGLWCAPGGQCVNDEVSTTCWPVVPVGAPCDGHVSCDYRTAYCDQLGTKTCIALLENGALSDDPFRCKSTYIDDTGRCATRPLCE